MKIGIMGGTFDPIHNGHLMLGEYAYRNFGLDQIWFMPNGNPPHKKSSNISQDGFIRAEMVELAVKDVPYFRLHRYEVDKETVSCSYQTFSYLAEAYPEHEFYFIIGADSLFQIETWVHPELLFPNCVILAAYRDDVDTKKEMLDQISYLTEKYDAKIQLLETPLVPVSSSEIRKKLSEQEDVSAVLPKSIVTFIKEHHLYQV